MANINIIPVMKEQTESSAGTEITVSVVCPSGKRILLDTIECEFGTSHASNVVNIKFEENGPSGSPANIIPVFGDFRYTRIHLASWFPRAVEMEETDELQVIFTRSGADSTLACRIFYIQRDE